LRYRDEGFADHRHFLIRDGDADDVMAAGYKEAVQIGQAGNLRLVYPESTMTKFSQKTSELSGQQHEKGSVYVECI
jgi:hypothetical protein